MLSWIQQGLCGLHGHDALLHYERNRITLRCVSCGHETPGWEVARRPLVARARAHPPMPADLSVARKIA